MVEYIWNQKGKTFSDKTARKQYEIKQEDIIDGINLGVLQYRENCIHGNPFLRLIKKEVENFVVDRFGEGYLKKLKKINELSRVNQEIRKHKKEIKKLEKQKEYLTSLD
jgi:hypothetical protein